MALAGCGKHAVAGNPSNGATAAEGILQKCLGTSWGAAAMHHGAQTAAYCNQLSGADLYNRAGALYQEGNRAGAAAMATKAAQAGNALAQLRLAMMYDHGDGVAHDPKQAFDWFSRAAAQGEPGAQEQLGGFYEQGGGVVQEDWGRAYNYYYASAMQGWKLGQFSLGRAYQFGIGVPQDRALAIEWFQKAGAQDAPRAQYFAQWLTTPTNNVGFRNEMERSTVLAGKLRFGLLGGDPAGIAFHSSSERLQWLQGQSRSVDKREIETFRAMHKADREACLSAGRDNCN